MNSTLLNIRVRKLQGMHDLICMANDEDIIMRWLTLGVPDCPSIEDFRFIAEDDERYEECFNLFKTLICNKGYN